MIKLLGGHRWYWDLVLWTLESMDRGVMDLFDFMAAAMVSVIVILISFGSDGQIGLWIHLVDVFFSTFHLSTF
jgi:hypothetical protein